MLTRTEASGLRSRGKEQKCDPAGPVNICASPDHLPNELYMQHTSFSLGNIRMHPMPIGLTLERRFENLTDSGAI